MKAGPSLLAAAIGTLLYVLALLWVDSSNQVLARLPQVAASLPVLVAAALLSYALRYLRWRWLLRRAQAPTPLLRGWLAYLTGFAFTATPGKVGELVRIRYFGEFGVPPQKVLAAFVFERAADLLAVLLFAGLAIHDPAVFLVVLGFVAGLLGLVVLVGSRLAALAALAAWLRRRKLEMLARLASTLREGLAGCRSWLNAGDVAVTMGLGLLAWGVIALSFVWLLARLGVELPFASALSLYPTAMLAGAASMLPAGIGSTELTIVALLALHAVPVGTATLAAVAIRFSGLWFAIACGLLAIGILERSDRLNPPGR